MFRRLKKAPTLLFSASRYHVDQIDDVQFSIDEPGHHQEPLYPTSSNPKAVPERDLSIAIKGKKKKKTANLRHMVSVSSLSFM
jgi:hypothetical protein